MGSMTREKEIVHVDVVSSARRIPTFSSETTPLLEFDRALRSKNPKGYREALRIAEDGLKSMDEGVKTNWLVLCNTTAVYLKEKEEYSYAGEFLELRAKYSRPEWQEDRYGDAARLYEEGASASVDNRQLEGAQYLRQKAMAVYRKAGDYAGFARVAGDSTYSYVDESLEELKQQFNTALQLHKGDLTEEGVTIVVEIMMKLQYKSNKYKHNDNFVLKEYKKMFDALPDNLKLAANEGFRRYSEDVFNKYANSFETKVEIAERGERKRQEERTDIERSKVVISTRAVGNWLEEVKTRLKNIESHSEGKTLPVDTSLGYLADQVKSTAPSDTNYYIPNESVRISIGETINNIGALAEHGMPREICNGILGELNGLIGNISPKKIKGEIASLQSEVDNFNFFVGNQLMQLAKLTKKREEVL